MTMQDQREGEEVEGVGLPDSKGKINSSYIARSSNKLLYIRNTNLHNASLMLHEYVRCGLTTCL